MEILPMICGAAGIQSSKGVKLDGYDMVSVLAGKKKSPRKEMF
jgi:arylsulfatase A-like enzyme